MIERNKIYCGDCVTLMKDIPENTIDLTVTSPPYDNLRSYNGFSFDFENTAKQLYRITKPGGVVVWVVADATINGSETGTSFRQALYFKDIGFNLHDTMIWNKGGFTATGTLKYRYGSVFEYMLIFSKGFPKTFNPIKDRKNKAAGKNVCGTVRQRDGSTRPAPNRGKTYGVYGQRFNVWDMTAARGNERSAHPAPFPEALARDHILSWSNPGDLVIDPFCGSGTTCKMAQVLNRDYIGIDCSEEYCKIAKERLGYFT